MGVEIQTEAFTVVGIDLDGDVFFSHSEPLDIRTTNLVDSFVTIVQRFQPAIESTGMNLIGIGVGLPGFVDPVRGELLASMPLGLFDPIPFVELSRRRLGFDIPILVDNDANCGCWGELAFRHTERPDNFMFVLGEQRKHTVEMDDYRIMALGLGLVLNGRVHHGHEYSAGEFRSVLYRPGQINQFSIADDQARLFLQDHGVNESIADELARHISFLVHTLNLGKVVIGGPIEVLSDILIPRVETHVDNNWAYPGKVKCDIAVSRLGEQAVAFGAAGMFLEHLITFPDMAADRERSIYGVDLLRFMIKGRAGGKQ